MFSRYRTMRRTGIERSGQEGFTLIELLIVIIIMGILAAVVVFALGGVTSSSAKSACNTDAKTVEVGIAAYQATNSGGAFPGSIADLVGTTKALRSWPSNSTHYYIGIVISGETGVRYETSAGVTAGVDVAGVSPGQVWVSTAHTDAGAATPATWTNYDTSVTAGADVCNTVT